eukprot:GHVU01119311.1.p1 GENE.GHVU01119311.1~~GHVU01119311.1.p1  ORF type:complete len:342 (-),score=32.86 GHVU01119311.1:58-1083(-)
MSGNRSLVKELLETDSSNADRELLLLSIASNISSELGATDRRPFGGSRQGKHPNLDRNWQRAEQQLIADYFAPNALYSEGAFQRRFRLRKCRFLKILEDMSSVEYMQQGCDAAKRLGASTLMKMTAALRVLGHATSTDMFDEYARISESSINECVKNYCTAMVALYQDTYLRGPTPQELDSIVRDNEQRGFPGMFGSIDCFHWEWQNCPTAWRGQYLGKEGKPSVVTQAVADRYMRIWDLHFGTPGSNNDITVLHRSDLIDKFAVNDSIFKYTYTIGEHTYNKCYVLGDGIYPEYNFIVTAFRSPVTLPTQLFTRRQESTRKDVERTFGVLRFQRAQSAHV